MPDNSNYAYIVGRLRALETKMINQTLLERLLDAKDADEAFRVINDMPLIMGSMGEYGPDSFNKVLVDALHKMKDLFIQMAPYPLHLNFLWYKYDFHNLKVILKAELTEKGYSDVSHALIDLGNISSENWEKYLLEGKKIELTEDLLSVIGKVKALYEKTYDPQVIDMVIDQHLLDEQKKIAGEMGSKMISDYLSRIIDFSNLKAFIRVKELNRNLAYLETMLLSGGNIDLSVFTSAFERGYDELKTLLDKQLHGDDLAASLEEFIQNRNMSVAEKKYHDLQQKFMRESRRISFGPEPVFAFFWRFENHLNIIRSVLIGKLNKLPTEDISKYVLAL